MQIYLSEVLDWHADLTAQNKWDEKLYIPPRRKLITALQGISEYNPEAFLKRIPPDALYEERAILLGKMNQHELALSIYVHKVLFCLFLFYLMVQKGKMVIYWNSVMITASCS